MLLKCCTQYASKFGKLSSGHRTGKYVFIPIPKKGNGKECSNYHIIALISHTSKVMLKILQAKFQQYMNPKLPDVEAEFFFFFFFFYFSYFGILFFYFYFLFFFPPPTSHPITTFWVIPKQRNQGSNCQHLLNHRKSKRFPVKQLLLLQ